MEPSSSKSVDNNQLSSGQSGVNWYKTSLFGRTIIKTLEKSPSFIRRLFIGLTPKSKHEKIYEAYIDRVITHITTIHTLPSGGAVAVSSYLALCNFLTKGSEQSLKLSQLSKIISGLGCQGSVDYEAINIIIRSLNTVLGSEKLDEQSLKSIDKLLSDLLGLDFLREGIRLDILKSYVMLLSKFVDNFPSDVCKNMIKSHGCLLKKTDLQDDEKEQALKNIGYIIEMSADQQRLQEISAILTDIKYDEKVQNLLGKTVDELNRKIDLSKLKVESAARIPLPEDDSVDI